MQPFYPPRNKYDDIQTFGLENLNIKTPDSPIFQHPIPIPALTEKHKFALKQMDIDQEGLSGRHSRKCDSHSS